jgi:hypothetical protein
VTSPVGAPGHAGRATNGSARAWTPNLTRDATLLVGLLVGVGQVAGLAFPPIDASAYWHRSMDLGALYPNLRTDSEMNYLYPPPLAQSLAPFHFLPESVFWILTTVACFWALWYLAGRWTPVFIVFGVGLMELGAYTPLGVPYQYALLGNIQLLMTAAMVAGLTRHPGWWAVVILTKVGPGIGVLWFVARGEWRQLGIALGATALITGISFALSPGLWTDWIEFIWRNADVASGVPMVPVPFGVRLAMSAAIVVWGARTDRSWTVAIAAGWAMPSLYYWSFMPVWIGAIRLLQEMLAERAQNGTQSERPALTHGVGLTRPQAFHLPGLRQRDSR